MNAKEATIRRFTNLLDGSVIPSVSVSTIIDYYENLKQGKKVVVNENCNISNKFNEEEIREKENEADYWDGDESYNFLQ